MSQEAGFQNIINLSCLPTVKSYMGPGEGAKIELKLTKRHLKRKKKITLKVFHIEVFFFFLSFCHQSRIFQWNKQQPCLALWKRETETPECVSLKRLHWNRTGRCWCFKKGRRGSKNNRGGVISAKFEYNKCMRKILKVRGQLNPAPATESYGCHRPTKHNCFKLIRGSVSSLKKEVIVLSGDNVSSSEVGRQN